jgi:hypothetical protein
VETKIFRKGDMLMGLTGTIRTGQLLEHVLTLPEHPDGLSNLQYLIREVAPEIQKVAENNRGVRIDDEQHGWAGLIAYGGELFYFSDDLGFCEVPAYEATGCAKDVALGSLFTTATLSVPAKARVSLALQAAVAHDIHVEVPLRIFSLKDGENRG